MELTVAPCYCSHRAYREERKKPSFLVLFPRCFSDFITRCRLGSKNMCLTSSCFIRLAYGCICVVLESVWESEQIRFSSPAILHAMWQVFGSTGQLFFSSMARKVFPLLFLPLLHSSMYTFPPPSSPFFPTSLYGDQNISQSVTTGPCMLSWGYSIVFTLTFFGGN